MCTRKTNLRFNPLNRHLIDIFKILLQYMYTSAVDVEDPSWYSDHRLKNIAVSNLRLVCQTEQSLVKKKKKKIKKNKTKTKPNQQQFLCVIFNETCL